MALQTGATRVVTTIVVVATWLAIGAVGLGFVGVIGLGAFFAAADRCPGLPPEPPQPKRGAVPGGGFTWIAAGGSQTCAQTKAGQLWCWGKGSPPAPRIGPAHGAGAPYRQFAVHDLGLCGIGADQVLHCDRISSASVAGWIALPGARKVVLGRHHGCVIKHDHSLWCFGTNSAQQVAATTQPWIDQPAQVGLAVKDVALGAQHTCAVLDSGKVRCWGSNAEGQLGPAAEGDLGAREPALPGAVTSVAVGDTVSCALLADGGVTCWGRDRLDSDKYYKKNPPTRIKLDRGATQLGSSERTGCALLNPNTLTCWGQNYACAYRDYYCRGDDLIRDLAVPGDAVQLAVADEHSCVLLSSGNIACVGSHENNRLGRALPFVETTHYSFHAESCNTQAWEEPPGWPHLLPVYF
jgi:alpha-tubulin suppressor-like RCC1 family protein